MEFSNLDVLSDSIKSSPFLLASLIGPVFLIPFNVMSYIQEKMIAIGNPTHNKMIIKFNVQSGKSKEGATISVSSIRTNATVA